MTKNDYQVIANVLAAEFAISITVDAKVAIHNVVFSLADKFAQANPRFDRGRFYRACGVEH